MTKSHDAIRARIEELAAPVAAAKGAYIIEAGIRGEGGGKVVEVFLDADEGLSTGTCAAISREISRLLDEGDVIAGRYHLVVSSPGVDRPLKFLRQYRKHVGRSVRLTVRTGEGTKAMEGVLVAVGDDEIEIQAKKGDSLRVSFGDIVEGVIATAW